MSDIQCSDTNKEYEKIAKPSRQDIKQKRPRETKELIYSMNDVFKDS